jgi:hypothetical protein
MKAEKQYQNNIAKLDLELASLKKRSNLWSYIRIITVLGGFATITVLSDKLNLSFLIGLTISFIVFLGFAVTQYLKVSALMDAKQKVKRINENEISVINQSGNLYDQGKDFALEYAEISNDLDLFGDNSVFHFINRTATYFGNKILKDYFMVFKDAEVIIERQKAVEEMSNKLVWRQEFQKELFDIDSKNNYKILMDFVAEESFVTKKKSKFNFLFYQNTAMLILYLASLIFFSKYSFIIFMIMFVINASIGFIYFKNVNLLHQMVSENGKALLAFYKSLQLLENEKWESGYLNKLTGENEYFSQQILKLKKLIEFFDFRLNMVIGLVLNIFFLWDLRILRKLDIWKQNNLDIEKHLNIIGEFEVLNSLAILKFNNPKINFPAVSEKEFEIVAKGMYHPLINKNEVVANDYDFEGTSRLDIITGPNMSGKSTFLRSVAINMILAKTGSAVFADKFVFTPSKVLTYLHITDSVKDKISTFRAEIIKLKSILDAIESSKVPTFFILDEILRGTNSHSKFKGSVAVVKRLLELKSSGIIATHDVHLGEMENDFNKEIRNFSFDFIVDEKQELVYDYKLKQGINTKVNAEIVLKELGLVL